MQVVKESIETENDVSRGVAGLNIRPRVSDAGAGDRSIYPATHAQSV
jgi:hypothetical protein